MRNYHSQASGQLLGIVRECQPVQLSSRAYCILTVSGHDLICILHIDSIELACLPHPKANQQKASPYVRAVLGKIIFKNPMYVRISILVPANKIYSFLPYSSSFPSMTNTATLRKRRPLLGRRISSVVYSSHAELRVKQKSCENQGKLGCRARIFCNFMALSVFYMPAESCD